MSLQITHSLPKLQERLVKKPSSSNKGRQYLQPDLNPGKEEHQSLHMPQRAWPAALSCARECLLVKLPSRSGLRRKTKLGEVFGVGQQP